MSIADVMASPCITAEGPGERGGQETVITALLASMPSSTKISTDNTIGLIYFINVIGL